MEIFLSSARTFVMKLFDDSLSTQKKIHVVLGNKAADLDSVISSLVYAYFLQNSEEVNSCVFIPIINCPRRDYILHTEVVYALDKASIDKDLLIFIDDLDLHMLKDKGILKGLTLVDHNVLAPGQRFMNDIIERIIDHHKDEQKDIEQSKKVIESVGSCCTLVAEQILKKSPSWLKTEISTLLVTTILVDTHVLPNVESRKTEKDQCIVNELSRGLPKDCLEIYKSIHNVRFDTSVLNGYDLLRKDFKCLTRESMTIAVSSVTTQIKDLVSRKNFDRDLSLFCEEESLDALMIMCIEVKSENVASTTTRQATTTRQLGIWGKNVPLVDHLINHLSANKQLQLEPMNLQTCEVRCFIQQNTSISRKTILPILKDVMSHFSV